MLARQLVVPLLPLLLELPTSPRVQVVQMKDRSRDNEVRWRTSQKEERRKKAQRSMYDSGMQRQRPSNRDVTKMERGQKRKLASRASGGTSFRKQRTRRRMGSSSGFKEGGVNHAGGSGYTCVDSGDEPMNTAMIEAVLIQREQARRAGDYASADRLRETLRAMGVEVFDRERVWRKVTTAGARRDWQWRSTRERDYYLELFFRGLALFTRR